MHGGGAFVTTSPLSWPAIEPAIHCAPCGREGPDKPGHDSDVVRYCALTFT